MSPLPFAPPPKDSSLYQQLESTTLQTLTADQLDTIRAKTFSQGTEGNEDEYRRLLLLGLAADQLSLSGPMPGTAKIVTVSETSGGAYNFFVPDAGEVWQVTGCSNGDKDATTVVKLTDAAGNTVELGQESAAQQAYEPFGSAPIYIDSNVYLMVNLSSAGGGTTEVHASFIRVR